MAGESDGIEEALQAQLRTLLMAASRVGERISRAREQALRNAQANSEQEARELASRLTGEKATARAQLGNLYRSGWWDTATPQQVADTYQLAHAWSGRDPEAAQAERQMQEELRGRYGIDAATLEDDPAVQNGLDARREAVQQQAVADGDSLEAATLMAAADAIEQHAKTESAARDQHPAASREREVDVDYDSGQRREQFAQDLIASGVEPEHARGRVLADAGRSEPASSSIRQSRKAAPQASKARAGRGARMQRNAPER